MADTAAEASSVELDEEPGESPHTNQPGAAKQVSVSLRSLVIGVVIVALALATAVMTWMYFAERSALSASQQRAADRTHAEQIALDYAVNAAAMSYQKMPEWKDKLVQGTSQNLRQKLTEAATSMEQLLVPLEWSSTAKPLAAKVRSETNGVYVVDTFVSVLTKTTQTPDNLQSTATYSITVDGNAQWQITDVGGIGNVLGSK
jgi:flagellar basal body-associated protein FliL